MEIDITKGCNKMQRHNPDLDSFQERIGYVFNNVSLLKNALTHSSYANEVKIKKNR